MPSTRVNTALKFIAGFDTLSDETLIGLRTPDCQHLYRPGSLSMPPQNKDEAAAHCAAIRNVVKSFPITPKEIMEDENENRVIIWATGSPTYVEGLKDDGLSEEDWDYQGEYVFIFNMDESGEKIRRIVEFLDSKAAEKAIRNMRRLMANKERLGK